MTFVVYKIELGKYYYYGSTDDMKRRFTKHRSDCFNQNTCNRKVYKYMRSIGITYDNFYDKIIPIEICSIKPGVIPKYIENKFIDLSDPYCLNTYRAYITEEERNSYHQKWREENPEKAKKYRKKYRENNQDKIKKQQKEYYEENKDKAKKYRENNIDKYNEYQKEYRENNQEKAKKYQKKYRENNIDKAKGKTICYCGGRYTHQNKSIHFKTKKHQLYKLFNQPIDLYENIDEDSILLL